MKIGFDAKRFFFNHSGLGNYSRMLIESLFKYFPENEYVLYADRLDTLDHAHPEALRILKFYVDNRSDGSDLYTLVMVDAPKWWRTWGMGKRAAQDGVEVFHGLSNELPWDLPTSVASVCTIHDVIFKEFPSYYPWIDRLIYDFKTKKAIQKASRLIMTSQATQLQVEKYYPNAKGCSVVVYQAVDPAFYGDGHVQRTRETNAPYFVYQSSFTQRKNHAVLVDAFALIQHQTDWNLTLIGLNGPTLAAVQLQIEKLGLGNRITCLVDQSRQEMIDCVTGAAGFVYPSLNEGFGIPLAEALAAGLPMAVSNISVFRELTEDLPVYFHPNKAEEMASAMISITTAEEQTRQRLKRPSLQSKIDPKTIAEQLIRVYSDLKKA
jgi:glycosyltransferase involved in cell wall biosynthesis